jgi:Terminase large subunit, T4likevirus-type, N-terminal/Terminase RNaseH-like domain
MEMRTESYKGNHNIKRAGVKYDFGSNPDHFEEFIKCAQDPFYFIENYCKIIKPGPGLINFEPFEYQKRVIEDMIENRFTILKWPRQYGKTTTVGAIMLWYVLFNKNYTVALLAHQEKQSREILERIQVMFEHLPTWLQQGVVGWNKGTVQFENGSKLFTSATSSSSVRGRSIDWIYLDEFAFVPENMQEEFLTSAFPTITSGDDTKMTISSTPNGMNLFYRIWHDSENGNNDFVRNEVHWSDMPGRDWKWRENMIKNTSEEQFRQEFETEFLGSSNTLIDVKKLRMLRQLNPISTSGQTKIYQAPDKNCLYAIIVDTGTGSGLDYSAFIVFNITQVPYEVVCTYRSKAVSPYIYPNVIFEVAKKYNNAYILIESQVGSQVADILHMDLEYENILSSQTQKSGQSISGGYTPGSKLGVQTSRSVKRIGCSNLKSLIESDKLVVNDYDIIYELSRFVANSRGSFEAEVGHDDYAMCLVLFAWLTNQQYFRELCDVDVRQHILDDSETLLEDDISPFGFLNDDSVEEVEDVRIVVSDWLIGDMY